MKVERRREREGDRLPWREMELERWRERGGDRYIDMERDMECEREREINEMDLLKVYLGDLNRQPRPSREHLEGYPYTNPSMT